MVRNILIALILILSSNSFAAPKLPRKIEKIECSDKMNTLDFIWDSDRSPWVAHIYVNGKVETGDTRVQWTEEGDLYSKPGVFTVSIRKSDDKGKFKKIATIHDQLVELDCEHTVIWDKGDFGGFCDFFLGLK